MRILHGGATWVFSLYDRWFACYMVSIYTSHSAEESAPIFLASIVASYFRSFNIEPFYLLNLGMAAGTVLVYMFVVYFGIGLSIYLLALSICHLVSVIIWYLINHDRWIKS